MPPFVLPLPFRPWVVQLLLTLCHRAVFFLTAASVTGGTFQQKYTHTKKQGLDLVKSTINNSDWRKLTSELSAKHKVLHYFVSYLIKYL
jgi:hypothetical protein